MINSIPTTNNNVVESLDFSVSIIIEVAKNKKKPERNKLFYHTGGII